MYNGESAKGLSHCLLSAYQRVLEISDIKFDFPADIKEYIELIDKQGSNRYFESSYIFSTKDCLKLDKTVWYLRKWCKYIRGSATIFRDAMEDIKSKKYKKIPITYRIFWGYLKAEGS